MGIVATTKEQTVAGVVVTKMLFVPLILYRKGIENNLKIKDMKEKVLDILKLTALVLLVAVGFIALMVLAGEDLYCEMPINKFVAYKVGAAAVIALCYAAGKKIVEL